jgi:hypothetical protein
MSRTGVAVEKVGFSEKSRKSGDRKCPGDWEKSFIEHPDHQCHFEIGGAKRISQHLSDKSKACRDSEFIVEVALCGVGSRS